MFVVVFGVGVLWLRLWNLGVRPLHHDESLDAWFSWRRSTGQSYTYDPAYHGPLRIILTGALFSIAGASDTTARVLAASSGLALIFTPRLISASLGRVGTSAASLAVAVSPSLVYFSRFGREDLPYVLVATIGSLAVVEHLRAPRRRLIMVGAVALAAAACIKETFAITVFTLVTFVALMVAVEWHGRDGWKRSPTLRRFTVFGSEPWWWAATAFVVIFVVSYSVLFTDPAGVWRGIWDGPSYWLGQHDVGRGGQSWTSYAVIGAAYEWPLLVLAVVGGWSAVRRPDHVRLFLVWSAVTQCIVYSWAGERFPWLVVHPLVPIALLAGLGVDHLWRWQRSTRDRAVVAATCVVALTWCVAMSVTVAQVRPNDPRELLVAVQTTDDVRDVVARLEAAAESGPLLVDGTDSGTWPFAWYLRDLPIAGYEIPPGGIPLGVSAAIIADANLERLGLSAQDGMAFDLRATWLPDATTATPAAWWTWYTTRDTWNPVQRVPFHLFLFDPATGAATAL